MQAALKISRLILPTLLLGYGIIANIGVFIGPQTKLAWPAQDLLSGGLTRDFEHDYKTTLPHYDLAFGAIGALRYIALNESRGGAAVGADGWLFTSEDMRVLPKDALSTAIKQIKTVQAQLVQHGAELVLLPIPAKIDIAGSHAQNPSHPQAMAGLYTQFVGLARSHNLPIADPRADMLASPAPVFFATDTHWTRHGAQIAARAVAKTLPLGTQSYQYGPLTQMQVTGDLIRYVTTNQFAPRIGLLPETISRGALLSVAAPLDIFADAPVDIALIGTSYSANTDWGFADALMMAVQRDVVNLAVAGLGPVQPMRSYLRNLAENPAEAPRVVVWEFPIRYLTDPALWNAPAPPAQSGAAPSLVVLND